MTMPIMTYVNAYKRRFTHVFPLMPGTCQPDMTETWTEDRLIGMYAGLTLIGECLEYLDSLKKRTENPIVPIVIAYDEKQIDSLQAGWQQTVEARSAKEGCVLTQTWMAKKDRYVFLIYGIYENHMPHFRQRMSELTRRPTLDRDGVEIICGDSWHVLPSPKSEEDGSYTWQVKPTIEDFRLFDGAAFFFLDFILDRAGGRRYR